MSEVATLEAWLYQGNVPLSMLFLGVVLLSYLLEDLAIVTAATLAVEQVIPTPLALLAIFTGIATGDIGLYWLGKLAQRYVFSAIACFDINVLGACDAHFIIKLSLRYSSSGLFPD